LSKAKYKAIGQGAVCRRHTFSARVALGPKGLEAPTLTEHSGVGAVRPAAFAKVNFGLEAGVFALEINLTLIDYIYLPLIP